MQIKFTDRGLRGIEPKEKRFDLVDKETPGLRLRISPSGIKSFALVMRDAGSRLRTITLGQYDPNAPAPQDASDFSAYGDRLSLASARRKAALARAIVSSGGDPTRDRRTARIEAQERAASATPLGVLLEEYESGPGQVRKIWTSGDARRRIEAVFAPLLSKDAAGLTVENLADAMADYRPKRGGKMTANGQVSKARAYLGPVLSWAAGRKPFQKAGAHRKPRLDVPSISETYDPASEDPTITGERDRVLTEEELRALLPALHPVQIDRKGINRGEVLATEGLSTLHGPALRFILLTGARLGEVTAMRWGHVDFGRAEWFKPSVKSTRGGPRSQTLPLSGAATELLMSLPSFADRRADEIVFASATGGELMNWSRACGRLARITGVAGWHRHDLRRTTATIMEAIGVAPRVIEQILAHKNPLKAEGVGGTAGVYIRLGQRFGQRADPQRAALETLARALHEIEIGEVASTNVIDMKRR